MRRILKKVSLKSRAGFQVTTSMTFCPKYNFNVAQALVGTECTCAVFLEATVRLIKRPKARSLLLLGYHDVFDAGDHVTEIMKHKPIGLEGMDDKLVNYMHKRGLHEEDLVCSLMAMAGC